MTCCIKGQLLETVNTVVSPHRGWPSTSPQLMWPLNQSGRGLSDGMSGLQPCQLIGCVHGVPRAVSLLPGKWRNDSLNHNVWANCEIHPKLNSNFSSLENPINTKSEQGLRHIHGKFPWVQGKSLISGISLFKMLEYKMLSLPLTVLGRHYPSSMTQTCSWGFSWPPSTLNVHAHVKRGI